MYLKCSASRTRCAGMFVSTVQAFTTRRPKSVNPNVSILDTASVVQPPYRLLPSTAQIEAVLKCRSTLVSPTTPAGTSPWSAVYARNTWMSRWVMILSVIGFAEPTRHQFDQFRTVQRQQFHRLQTPLATGAGRTYRWHSGAAAQKPSSARAAWERARPWPAPSVRPPA